MFIVRDVIETIDDVTVTVLVDVLGVNRQDVGADLGGLRDGRVVKVFRELRRVVVFVDNNDVDGHRCRPPENSVVADDDVQLEGISTEFANEGFSVDSRHGRNETWSMIERDVEFH